MLWPGMQLPYSGYAIQIQNPFQNLNLQIQIVQYCRGLKVSQYNNHSKKGSQEQEAFLFLWQANGIWGPTLHSATGKT